MNNNGHFYARLLVVRASVRKSIKCIGHKIYVADYDNSKLILIFMFNMCMNMNRKHTRAHMHIARTACKN